MTPDEFADAVKKEKHLQAAYMATTEFKGTPFFHASRVPLGEVVFRPRPESGGARQLDMFINECEGICGV